MNTKLVTGFGAAWGTVLLAIVSAASLDARFERIQGEVEFLVSQGPLSNPDRWRDPRPVRGLAPVRMVGVLRSHLDAVGVIADRLWDGESWRARRAVLDRSAREMVVSRIVIDELCARHGCRRLGD